MVININGTEKEATVAEVIEARRAGRLEKLLPSGTNIPFTFSTGEENSFDVGRDGSRTYLILHDSMAEQRPMDAGDPYDGGWAKCGMRRHVQELFWQLPEEIRKIALPVTVSQKIYDKVVSCEDMAFLLSLSQIYGEGELYYWTRREDCYDEPIDIFEHETDRIKRPAGASGASQWWLRSSKGSCDCFSQNEGKWVSIGCFENVSEDGGTQARNGADKSGVVFGICIEEMCGNDVVLIRKPHDEGVTLHEFAMMGSYMRENESLPLDIEGDECAAVGLIGVNAAKSMHYDYSDLVDYVHLEMENISKLENGEYGCDDDMAYAYTIHRLGHKGNVYQVKIIF